MEFLDVPSRQTMKNGCSWLTPLALGVAVVSFIPAGFTLKSVLSVDSDLWVRLYNTRLSIILPNTFKLLLSVGVLTALIGIPLAWFVSRYDFFGKRIWQWALVLPLAVPGYVLAYTYASLMAPSGPAQNAVHILFGETCALPSLYGFWGVSLVLSLVNFPYVYLLSRTAFANQNAFYDDAARVLGSSRFKRFWTVHICMATPAIVAGVCLVLMEVMADFGTVSLLRYPTFTESIYRQMTGRFDPSGAAALSCILVGLTLVFLFVERRLQGDRRYQQGHNEFKPFRIKQAAPILQFFFLAFMGIVLGLSFFLPAVLLIKWATQSLMTTGWDSRFPGFVFNTLLVAAAGATLTMLLALPVSYLHARRPTFLSRSLYLVSSLGYSLPGPVVAVGLLLFASLCFPWLLGGMTLLLLAYLVRFIPISLQSQNAALSMIPASIEDTAKTLGAKRWQRFRQILFPLLKPSLLTGWVVVFMDCAKELPATLMLRPLAFDTLAVRVWMEASESLWEMAALPALLIVIVSIVPTAFIINQCTQKQVSPCSFL
jgi:iron(III) transport system permease protein